MAPGKDDWTEIPRKYPQDVVPSRITLDDAKKAVTPKPYVGAIVLYHYLDTDRPEVRGPVPELGQYRIAVAPAIITRINDDGSFEASLFQPCTTMTMPLTRIKNWGLEPGQWSWPTEK